MLCNIIVYICVQKNLQNEYDDREHGLGRTHAKYTTRMSVNEMQENDSQTYTHSWVRWNGLFHQRRYHTYINSLSLSFARSLTFFLSVRFRNEMAHSKRILLICIKYKLNYMFVVHSGVAAVTAAVAVVRVMQNPKCVACNITKMRIYWNGCGCVCALLSFNVREFLVCMSMAYVAIIAKCLCVCLCACAWKQQHLIFESREITMNSFSWMALVPVELIAVSLPISLIHTLMRYNRNPKEGNVSIHSGHRISNTGRFHRAFHPSCKSM